MWNEGDNQTIGAKKMSVTATDVRCGVCPA